MPAALLSEADFIATWWRHQSSSTMGRELGVAERVINQRRKAIEKRTGIVLTSPDSRSNRPAVLEMPENQKRATLAIENGVVMVASDAHYWPGYISTAHRAFVLACKELKPALICMNGDSFDGSGAGRHPRIGWSKGPTVKQELDATRDRLAEIEAVRGNAHLHHTWGNHDLRFDTKLSAQVPEFEGVAGMSLKEHFPAWKWSMSLMVNDNTMVKHRYHNGVHAAYNNTVKSGRNIVTGHLHRLTVTAWGDYNGRRYGVDTGTLAVPDGHQFEYSEDTPSAHGSGFAVLTFYRGQMLPPELAEVVDEDAGLFTFRGQVIHV